MTTTTLELTTIEHLDFEAACDCRWCIGRAADFAVRLFCGCIRLTCRTCHEESKGLIIINAPIRMTCNRCVGTIVANLVSDFIKSVHPL